MKIAVQLDDNRNIIGTVTTSEFGAELQVKLFKDKGWTLVDNDPAFSVNESYLWTVRESDNKLVYLSDNQTPEERNQTSITALTQDGLATKMTTIQLQTAVTALTKSNLQLTLDNTQLKANRDTNQKAITDLTKEMMDFKLQAASTNASKTDTETTK
ncbi:hypothetical protein JMJ99_06725 [Companilactobacillus zhachilii]|uniref:hypothetical protein n=1 Tax=Companilactobacillus zhachilii TaxID=2304606 RepID=UPI001920BC8E|nr:hypothetical protein [Companilactobacillus zhachilii]MBL3531060.1 hypothetical protein [Companilactobacillus zhachilii]